MTLRFLILGSTAVSLVLAAACAGSKGGGGSDFPAVYCRYDGDCGHEEICELGLCVFRNGPAAPGQEDGGPPADGGVLPDGGLMPDGGSLADGGAMAEDGGAAGDGGPPDGGSTLCQPYVYRTSCTDTCASAKVKLFFDDRVRCFVNGQFVFDGEVINIPGQYWVTEVSVQDKLRKGKNSIACKLINSGEAAVFDAELNINGAVVIPRGYDDQVWETPDDRCDLNAVWFYWNGISLPPPNPPGFDWTALGFEEQLEEDKWKVGYVPIGRSEGLLYPNICWENFPSIAGNASGYLRIHFCID